MDAKKLTSQGCRSGPPEGIQTTRYRNLTLLQRSRDQFRRERLLEMAPVLERQFVRAAVRSEGRHDAPPRPLLERDQQRFTPTPFSYVLLLNGWLMRGKETPSKSID